MNAAHLGFGEASNLTYSLMNGYTQAKLPELADQWATTGDRKLYASRPPGHGGYCLGFFYFSARDRLQKSSAKDLWPEEAV